LWMRECLYVWVAWGRTLPCLVACQFTQLREEQFQTPSDNERSSKRRRPSVSALRCLVILYKELCVVLAAACRSGVEQMGSKYWVLDVRCDCVNAFLYGLWGGSTLPCLVVGRLMLMIQPSRLFFCSIWWTQIPRVLTLDPFGKRRDGGSSLGISVLRFLFDDEGW